jgi:hypothetical protein
MSSLEKLSECPRWGLDLHFVIKALTVGVAHA